MTPEQAEHVPRRNDAKFLHAHLLEVAISGNQKAGLRPKGKSDEVIIGGIVRHHAWRIHRVVEHDCLLGQPGRKSLCLLGGDVVLLRYPRMQQRLPHFVDELRADDQLELTI